MEYIADSNSADECGVKVKTQRPNAIGATLWSTDGTKRCYAHFGRAISPVSAPDRVSCLYPGNYIALCFDL